MACLAWIPQPYRRWLRAAFSVRTLLIVMTAIGCWLAWESHIVEQRLKLLHELIRISDSPGKVPVTGKGVRPMTIYELSVKRRNDMPFWRYWMGDVCVPYMIEVPWPPYGEKWNEMAWFFPECGQLYLGNHWDPEIPPATQGTDLPHKLPRIAPHAMTPPPLLVLGQDAHCRDATRRTAIQADRSD